MLRELLGDLQTLLGQAGFGLHDFGVELLLGAISTFPYCLIVGPS